MLAFDCWESLDVKKNYWIRGVNNSAWRKICKYGKTYQAFIDLRRSAGRLFFHSAFFYSKTETHKVKRIFIIFSRIKTVYFVCFIALMIRFANSYLIKTGRREQTCKGINEQTTQSYWQENG